MISIIKGVSTALMLILLAVTMPLFPAYAKTYTYQDPQGFFKVEVSEEVFTISSPKTDQTTILHVFSPLKADLQNHPVLAVNGGGHDPLYFLPFGMRFVARGITFCTVGWPGHEENDLKVLAKATFASSIALYESAAQKVTEITGKKPVGYFWSMGGIILSGG